MSGKTKKSAKLVWVLTAAVLLLSCFTTACQPTPEKAVVVNKADGKLEEKISESAPAQVQYSAPENLKESFTCKDENVQVNVDANVMLPRAKQYPVVDIVPEEISMDFVKTAAKVLMEGKMLYEPRTTLTKSEIQSEVLKLQKTLADPKHSTSDGLNAGDPKIVADTKKLFEDRIKIYQELLKTAPETYTPVEAKLEFKSIKYYEDQAFYKEQEAEWKKLKDDDQAKQLLDQYEHGQKLVLDAELGNGYHGRLTVENYNGEASRWNRLQFRKGTELNNQYGPDLGADVRETNMSKETAAALGQDLLSKLEIADMLLTSVSPISSNQSKKDIKPQAAVSAEDASGKTYGYTLVFNRSFGGIPTITENSSFKADVEDYGPYYALESIRIVVQNDEIVSFDWNNPSKQVEIENSSVALKSFEEIKKLFKNQMSLEYNLGKLSLIEPENPDYEKYVANLASGKITIDKIQLGMVRLSIKDRPWVYRMIPAWKFYGNEFVELKTKNDDFPSKVNQISCFETINAIDGSVIDGK